MIITVQINTTIGDSNYQKSQFISKLTYKNLQKENLKTEDKIQMVFGLVLNTKQHNEAEKRDLHYIEDGFNCYYTILKDPKQLDKVFKYYDKK